MKSFVMECDIMCFRGLGVSISKVGDCFVSNTGSSNPILNCVYNFNENGVDIESMRHILDEFNALGLPHCWWTETSTESPETKELLRAHHKKPLGEFLGMALEVSESRKGIISPDLKISRVVTDSDFTAWSNVIAEAFEFSESDSALYTSLFAKAGTDGPFYHLVGYINGEIVSTGTILCTAEGAYIYNLATRYTQRGRGYGSTMTNALLEIAKHKKQGRVALVSTLAATSIHHKLGFQEICRFHIYV